MGVSHQDSNGRDEAALNPERCLSFTVSGPWGHFRRIEGNIVKQTYRVIPRTTVAGLIGAIVGIQRDGYYRQFRRDRSAIAIEPLGNLRTINLPVNALSTAEGDLQSLNPYGTISIKLPDPSHNRQQHNYELLVDPAYRIDVSLDGKVYERLKTKLEAGRSHYVPSLGLSEHLANIEFHGEFSVESQSGQAQSAVQSIVPGHTENVVPASGTRWHLEKSPAFMRADEKGRTTTGFATYAYTRDGKPLMVEHINPGIVDDRTVVFF